MKLELQQKETGTQLLWFTGKGKESNMKVKLVNLMVLSMLFASGGLWAAAKNITVQEEQKAQILTFDIIGANAKIKRATGWRPRVSMDQSLKNTLQYYREL